MKRLGKEFAVGCLVLLAALSAVVFAWLMGALNPFRHEARFEVLYAFAGGVEVGSPVRVSGVKVGRVERIEFLPPERLGNSSADGATVKLVVTVSQGALPSLREDSRFYVNMAGIIGERYVEISPGGAGSAPLRAGATVRGVDPPRVDQLLSQGYGVFGKIQDFLDRNERAVEEMLKQVEILITDLNKALKGSDKRRILGLIDNLHEITTDVKGLTKKLTGDEAREFFLRLDRLVEKADAIDKPMLKKFLQEEGIRARIF